MKIFRKSNVPVDREELTKLNWEKKSFHSYQRQIAVESEKQINNSRTSFPLPIFIGNLYKRDCIISSLVININDSELDSLLT